MKRSERSRYFPLQMRLAVPGRHMALNALAALLAAVNVGAPVDAVLDGLAGFEGVRRRLALVGTVNGVRVFDDYAHHPTEVRAALIGAGERLTVERSGTRDCFICGPLDGRLWASRALPWFGDPPALPHARAAISPSPDADRSRGLAHSA